MKTKSTVIMLVGLPASGKSTFAERIARDINATIISSDKLREELYGDVNNQDNNVNIFEELYRRARFLLESGNDVIIDATNISQKRRIHFNKEFREFTRNVIYFNVSVRACILYDSARERTVGEEVISKMYKNLQVPTYAEGWDNIDIIYDKCINTIRKKESFEDILLQGVGYHELFDIMNLGLVKDFSDCYELPQDNPHHTFSVGRHIHDVYMGVLYSYQETDREDLIKMLWVAIFHDVGKAYTKTFTDMKGNEKRYASFYGHENCSSQLAVSFLHNIGYDDNFILDVAELVQLHMKLLNASEKSRNKLRNFVGEEKFNKLEFLRDIDINAK